VWFVGLEYAGGYKSAAAALEKFAACGEVDRPTEPPDFSEFKREGLAIRHLTSRVLSQLSRSAAGHDHEWFLKNRLWWPGSETFQANLFPLGHPSHVEDLPKEYLREFGLADMASYLEAVVRERFPRLRHLWRASAQKAAVCFGSTEEAMFKTLFEVTSEPEDLVPGVVRVFRRERVLVTPFFDFRLFGTADAERVGRFLRDELRIEIP